MSLSEAIGLLELADPSSAQDAQREWDELLSDLEYAEEQLKDLQKEKDDLEEEFERIKDLINNLYNEI